MMSRSKSWLIDRRTFLRGTAAAVPLPFLNMMSASAATLGEKPPVRFMTLFKPNGVHPPSWNINNGTEKNFRLAPMMAPFAKHKDDLLILDNMGDFGFSAHSHSTRRFLAGHHSNKRSASVDQMIADKIGADTAIRSLELTTEGLFVNQIGCSYISYDKKGKAIPRESDPQLIFDRVFNNPMRRPEKRKELESLLDRVNDNAKSLMRRAGKEDQETLDQYLTAIRETEKRLENMKPSQDLKNLPANLQDQRPGRSVNMDEQVNAMLDTIALALWTDSTRCITYMLGNSNSRMVFDFLGIKKQHHYLSHFFRNNGKGNLESLLKVTEWHMKKFDRLLTKMKSYKDQHGTLLDNSVVLYGSGMGHSDNHTATRVPIVLAGKGGGMLKTGRYVRYSENQRLSRLHLTLLHKFGIKSQSFAGNKSPLPGLDGSDFKSYKERPFDSWVKQDGKVYEIQGRLRMSDKLDETRVFFMDVKGRPPIRMELGFGDFHGKNVAYHVGTAITIKATGQGTGDALIIKQIKELKSVFGRNPGSAGG
jgi:hypothetical protein